jgi:hypothetical protein
MPNGSATRSGAPVCLVSYNLFLLQKLFGRSTCPTVQYRKIIVLKINDITIHIYGYMIFNATFKKHDIVLQNSKLARCTAMMKERRILLRHVNLQTTYIIGSGVDYGSAL